MGGAPSERIDDLFNQSGDEDDGRSDDLFGKDDDDEDAKSNGLDFGESPGIT
jgi:hypothetical protein